NDTTLKLIQFVYGQLCKFEPLQMKGQAIYVVLFEYFRKYIIGEQNRESCMNVAAILNKSRKQELEDDKAISQGLEMYIPLQASNYAYTDSNDSNAYDCYQRVVDLLGKKDKENQREQQ
ncbi:hypothetical protein RFI_38811, partial [Reticulomyxa filosa]